nr:TlpA family protein disulfide reductase [Alkalicoccus halolimnae]
MERLHSGVYWRVERWNAGVKILISYLILITAVGAGIFIFLTNQEQEDQSSEALEAYMENDGIERTVPDEEDTVSFQTVEEVGVEPGMEAADFELPLLSGSDTLSLHELRGNFVVVNMWATWCPPCREEMPDFVRFYEEYKDEGVEMIGVNMTASEKNKEVVHQFVDDFNIPFHTLLDEEGIMEEAYNVYVMPSTYIIDPDGRMVMNRPGYISYEILEENFLDIKENYEG